VISSNVKLGLATLTTCLVNSVVGFEINMDARDLYQKLLLSKDEIIHSKNEIIEIRKQEIESLKAIIQELKRI
jgi:replicative DNA helicase